MCVVGCSACECRIQGIPRLRITLEIRVTSSCEPLNVDAESQTQEHKKTYMLLTTEPSLSPPILFTLIAHINKYPYGISMSAHITLLS